MHQNSGPAQLTATTDDFLASEMERIKDLSALFAPKPVAFWHFSPLALYSS
jgi:hypothetical protein